MHVDASAHTIRLKDDDDGTELELGALRSSLVTAMGFIGKALAVEAFERDLSPIGAAIEGALQRAAGARRDAALEAAIAEVHPTPLLYSAPFLEARWLWADAFRFRACRTAIAHAEDLVIEEESPAAAVAVIARLTKWRELFACEGGGKKAINTALNDYGETMPTTALWGLRNVPLHRPRTAQAPLEVLGWLGSLHHTAPEVIALVEGAPDDELLVLLDGTDPRSGKQRTTRNLAAFLAQGDPDSRTLHQLLGSAREAAVPDPTAFARPPIQLPTEPGVRFIEDAAALIAEGERMHHCVAGLRGNCRSGGSYVFHIERDHTHATVHVNACGVVVEARGPFNHPTTAATWGAEVLAAWGAGLWMQGFPPDMLAWPPSLDTPPGARPLRSMRALAEAFDELAARAPHRRSALARWFALAASSAAKGMLGVCLDGERAWALSIVGDATSSDDAEQLHGRRTGAAPALAAPAAPAGRAPQVATRVVEPAVQAALLRPRAAQRRQVADPGPPIPLPRWMGIRRLPRPLAAPGWRFRCGDDDGTAIIDVAPDGTVELSGLDPHIAPAKAELWVARLRAWSHGFWGPRLGMDVSTWSELRAPALPPGTEALTTVGACHLVYTAACERKSDADGALARFYEQHVDAAIRGQAWLVVRDRAAGIVLVLDARRRIIGRTDDLVGAVRPGAPA